MSYTSQGVSGWDLVRSYGTESSAVYIPHIQGDTKKWELLKNPTKIEEIQEKNLFTVIEPLQLAF